MNLKKGPITKAEFMELTHKLDEAFGKFEGGKGWHLSAETGGGYPVVGEYPEDEVIEEMLPERFYLSAEVFKEEDYMHPILILTASFESDGYYVEHLFEFIFGETSINQQEEEDE